MRTKFSGILTLLLAFVVQITFAQEKTISGVVSDNDGLPLPGVNIIIKGTSSGTQTGFDGDYSLQAAEGDVLVFSYVGFETQEVSVGASSSYSVTMTTGSELDEVFIVAYGSQKRQKVSSAVANVNVERIDQVPIASIDQALQGLAAGVNAKVSSGQPGRTGQVIIRGRSSINGSVDPLYIVDNTPVDPDTFRSINQNDIASISVLKDAAASALYGNRAANGVIIITTKKGNFDSPLQVQYRSMYGVSVYSDPNFNVMNASQRLLFERDIFGSGTGVGLNDAEIAAISRQTNTNWADILFRQGTTNSHQLTLTQGSEKSRSYTSFGYFEQEGITRRSKLERFNFRTNYEAKPSDKFDYSTNLSVNYSKSDFVVDRDRETSVFAENTGGELDNPFIVPYIGLPYFSPYNANGSLNNIGTQQSGAFDENGNLLSSGANGFLNTPYLSLNTQDFNTDRENEVKILGNANANYHINDKLTAGARLGVDYTYVESLAITDPRSLRGLTVPDQNSNFRGDHTESYRRFFTTNINPFLMYNDTFNEVHDVSASVQTEYLYQNIQSGGFQAKGLNPNLPGSGNGFTDGDTVEGDDSYYYIPQTFSTEIEDASYSVFGTASYDYDNRFGVTGNIRRDGTSRFAKENRWGTFWSVSGRWNIHRESFLEGSNVVTNLKLRASYGKVGNRDVIPLGFYVGMPRVSIIGGYQGAPGYVPTSLVDPDLEWEVTTQTNIGLDFGLFEDRLTGALDVYNKTTDGLFYPTPVSLTTGFASVQSNVAEVSNKGVELQIAYNILKTDDFKIDVFANAAYNKNEVEALADSDFVPQGQTALSVGDPLRSFYQVRWAGVNPANGKPLYLDADGNVTETYSDNDRVLLDKSADPTYTGGFGTNISYKGFSLNGFFSFAADQWRTNGSLALLEDVNTAGFSNQSVTMLDAWQEPGDITGTPSIASGSTRLQSTDRYLEDASFLRLRNVTLAYNFSNEILERTKVFSGIRIYVQGTNLLTWSKWRGFDPESTFASSFFDYPTPRQFTAGVDITF